MAFDLPFSAPISMNADDPWLGGPNGGGHHGPDWTEQYGNDFGCKGEREVRAAFACTVMGTGWYPDLVDKVSKDGKKYGLQMIVASTTPAGQIEAYYTHIHDLAKDLKPGKSLGVGDYIGKVREMPGAPASTHLHFAMREKTASGWKGVELSSRFWEWAKDGTSHTIRFFGNGTAPLADPPPAAAPPATSPAPVPPKTGNLDLERFESGESPAMATAMGGCPPGGGAGFDPSAQPATPEEELALLSRVALGRTPAQLQRLQRAIGNRAIARALRSAPERLAAALPFAASAPTRTAQPAKPAAAEMAQRGRES